MQCALLLIGVGALLGLWLLCRRRLKVQKAHENILVVGASSHCFDKINVRVLNTVTLWQLVLSELSHMMMSRTSDLVQDAMGLFKLPSSLLQTFVGDVTLHSIWLLRHRRLKAQKEYKNILVVANLLVHTATALIRMMCACSTLWQLVLSELPSMMMSRTLQDAMGLFEYPSSLLPTFVGEVTVQQIQEIHSHLLEVNKAFRGYVTHTTGNVILHALVQNLHNIVAEIRDVR